MVIKALSKFAISYAVRHVFQKVNGYPIGGPVDIEIKKAFEEALKKWVSNDDLRKRMRNTLELEVNKLSSNPEASINFRDNPELDSFFPLFNEKLCRYHSAYRFLNDIKDQKRHQELILQLNQVNNKLEVLSQSVNNKTEYKTRWKDLRSFSQGFINQLLPETALRILREIEQSELYDHICADKLEHSKLYRLKSKCFALLGRNAESIEESITAFEICPEDLSNAAAACLAMARKGDVVRANETANAVLERDRISTNAWGCLIFLSKDKSEIEEVFERIPSKVKKDDRFKRLVVPFLVHFLGPEQSLEVIENQELHLDVIQDVPAEITAKQLSRVIAKLDIEIAGAFNRNLFHQSIQSDKEIDLALKKLQADLGHFFNQLSKTEIKDQYVELELILNLLNYLIDQKDECLEWVVSNCINIKSYWNAPILDLTTSCLIGKADFDGAVRLLDNQEGLNTFFLLKKLEISKLAKNEILFLETFKTLLSEINELDDSGIYLVYNLLYGAFLIGPSAVEKLNFSEFLGRVDYIDELSREMLETSFAVLSNPHEQNMKGKIESLKSKIDDKLTHLWLIVADLYFALTEFELAVAIYRKYVDTGAFSNHLINYVVSWRHTGNMKMELIALLKKMRLNLPFHERVARIEIVLLFEKKDHDEFLLACENFFTSAGLDQKIVELYVLILNERKDKHRLKQFSESIDDKSIQDERIVVAVSRIFIENDIDKGFYILYNKALDRKNALARSIYFKLFYFGGMAKKFGSSRQDVSEGWYIKYRFNDKLSVDRFDKGHKYYKELVNRRCGDELEFKRKVGYLKIKIEMVCDHYTALAEEILIQSMNEPLSSDLESAWVNISDLDHGKNMQ